jgi:predicted RNA binding protein YcfA (HicA-like mRNA interferase family)
MPISGRELMRLLEADGWERGRRSRHGIFFSKRFPGEQFPRSTVIPDKSDPLPLGTLGAILGSKQTRLGHAGLQDLIDRYP